jgi:Tol biopolymer transport system component
MHKSTNKQFNFFISFKTKLIYMKKNWLLLASLFTGLAGIAQNEAKWLRYPSISPDGKTIVFGYKGDIYKVASTGGEAVPLTIHEAHDQMPVWSKDGRSLAFASTGLAILMCLLCPLPVANLSA